MMEVNTNWVVQYFMAHPLAKVFGEYHIHVQGGGSDESEGGVPAATGYPVHACVFILL